MSLIICPECGAKISDQSKNCISCGFPIKAEVEEKVSNSRKLNRKQRFIVITMSVVLILLIALVFLFSNGLNKDEKIVMASCEKVQEVLLRPDTLIVYEAYVYEGDKSNQNVLLYYGAGNKGGGISDSWVLVKFDDFGESTIYHQYSEYEISTMEELEGLIAKLSNIEVDKAKLATYYDTTTEINVKKINDKLD